MNDCSFSTFMKSMELKRYKIQYCRVQDKPHIYVKTLGLSSVGLNEVFTISKSPYIEDAEILIKHIVKRLMETNQTLGIRRDLISHPLTSQPLRYLVKLAEEVERTLIVIGPDENNRLPGEKGYIQQY